MLKFAAHTIVLTLLLIKSAYAQFSSNVHADFSPVSIAKISNDYFIVADYRYVYLLYTNKNNSYALQMLPIILGNARVESGPRLEWTTSSYNPTGLYFKQDTKHVYIANYNGKNILIGKISPNYESITISKEIKNERMKSPENIYVDDSGIYVADYDALGGSIIAFTLDGDFKWQTQLSLAHGIAGNNSRLFATGLGNQKLVELDAATGHIIREHKPQNSNGSAFWYPTTLAVEEKEIVVIDANRGTIVFLDLEFNERGRFGSNGAAPGLFFRPYGFALLGGDHLLVADTGKARIARFSRDGSFQAEIAMGQKTHAGEGPWPGSHFTCGKDSAAVTGPVRDALIAAFDFPADAAILPGFQALCVITQNAIYTNVLLPVQIAGKYMSNARPSSIPYSYSFFDRFERGLGSSISLIGAPDVSAANVIDEATGAISLVTLPSAIAYWGGTVSAYSKFVEELGWRERDRIVTLQRQCGDEPIAAYLRLSYAPVDIKQRSFDDLLTALIWSPSKADIMEVWRRGGNPYKISRDWLKRSETLFLEDALILRMMQSVSHNRAVAAFEECRNNSDVPR